MRGNRINNHERELWVMNHEGLYNAFRRSRGGMRKFLKENREMIDEIIRAAIGD